MNRYQRRQLMRAQGHRGSKAKRQTLGQMKPHLAPQMAAAPTPDHVREAEEAQADHERRQQGRALGLVIPPSTAESEAIRASGKHPTGSSLVVPRGPIPPLTHKP